METTIGSICFKPETTLIGNDGNFFPDSQKEYRFTQIIPDTLKQSDGTPCHEWYDEIWLSHEDQSYSCLISDVEYIEYDNEDSGEE
jgi:hypothetical protein